MHPSLFGLTAYRQFIVYRVVKRPGQKDDKLPCHYQTGKTVSAHEPSTWTDAATAEATAAAWGPEWGVGFVFTAADPFWFLDIDGCLVNGQWSDLAVKLCNYFAGCAIEISRSVTGLHIIGTGAVPAHGCRNKQLGLEFYSSGRFVALTGAGATGDCLTDATARLVPLIANLFPPDAVGPSGVPDWTEGPCEGWNGPTDDQELIRRALQTKSASAAFGLKASFADLWTANEPALAKSYPDANGRPWDCSLADAALAQHLAFWTGNDSERMDRLMRLSGLVRDKYEREDYLPRTIRGATARQEEVLCDKPTPPAVAALGASLTVPSGTADELTPQDFWAHLPTHRYINVNNRETLSADALNGHLKRFSDQLGMKPSAYLDLFRAVQQMSWHPGHPSIIEGMISDDGVLKPQPKGRIWNRYKPSDAVGTEAAPDVWVNHIRHIYPADWEYIVQWFAYRIQHPGSKINHALVIGGKQGIGKDYILTPIRYGVGSSNEATIKPTALFERFTDWYERTLLVINEARDLGDESRYTFYEATKPIIAAPPDMLRVELKGLTSYAVPNVCAVVITTNNKLSGLYLPQDDRRHYIAWSPVDPPNKEYFDAAWEWMKNGGQQAVFGYLQRLDISSFSPTADPPKTEAWRQIVAASVNPEETSMSDAIEGIQIATVQEIIAALQLKGWSDLAMNLRKNTRKIPHILERIGLEQLPNPWATADGRWRLSDGRKDTLYVSKDLSYADKIRLAQERQGSV